MIFCEDHCFLMASLLHDLMLVASVYVPPVIFENYTYDEYEMSAYDYY